MKRFFLLFLIILTFFSLIGCNEHDCCFIDYIYNHDARCGLDGTETAYCDYGCGKTKRRKREGSALEHKFTNYVSDRNATYQKDGTKTAICDYGCGNTHTVNDDGSMLVNIEENVYVDGENGNNGNLGSQDKPLKTIQKAIDMGAKNIFVKVGDYSETINLTNKNDVHILPYNINKWDSSIPNTPMIHITGDMEKSISCGVYLENSNNILLENIWIDNTSSYGMYIKNCNNIQMNCCHCSNTGDSGFKLLNTNGIFRNCKAWNIALGIKQADGFNISHYGNSVFIDCEAHDCNDDGISHHDGATGSIIGGEFYNNGKAGIASPYGGAMVDVAGAYCHNNKYGLYSANLNGARTTKGRISNCIFINNTEKDIILNGDLIITMWNCKYDKIAKNTATFIDLTA